jgi:hypothetical protein
MKPPRVRFTVRRLMLVVAAVAFVAGAVNEVSRRRARFTTLASAHRFQAAFFTQRAQAKTQPFCGSGMSLQEIEEQYARSGPETLLDFRVSQYYRALSRKYDDAAFHPWFPVPPDPPQPK